ncbi:MAG TPA: nuclear transport factor 2 family protein [Burkholderiales bacterium]|nr:nuclear transport factor 2 family protein [Burkholderiales bacterium]
MKFWIAVAGSLVIFAVPLAPKGQTTDAQSTVQRYIDAQNAGNLEAALELWADDGVIINTRGRRVTGKENLKRFIEGNIQRKIHQKPESLQVVGSRVSWINRESNESYRRLGVAPVQQNSEMAVEGVKIRSLINYFPADEIARIEQACATPQAQGILLNDQPCDQFIAQARAQTARVMGSAAAEKRK